MKHARPLLLAASTLALFISACSQPADVQAPNLESQFGTIANDSATAVAVNSAHSHVFVAGVTGATEDKVFIRRYNRDGGLVWERLSAPQGVDSNTHVGGAGTDMAGNTYVAYAGKAVTLSKLNKSGSLLWRKQLTEADTPYEGMSVPAFVTDSAGNSYVGIQQYLIQDGGSFEYDSELRKYDPAGKLLWQRRYEADAVRFDDLAVGSGGAVYGTSRNDGAERTVLTKYDAGGQVAWQVEVNDGRKSYVAARGDSVYVADDSSVGPTYTEYSIAGALKRQVTAPRFTFSYLQDVSVDASNNVYLTDFVSRANDDSGDYDLVVQKHAPGGALLWAYAPRLAGTSEVTYTVAAQTTGELYVVGDTEGKVNGKNYGKTDAFLLHLDTAGKKVWSR